VRIAFYAPLKPPDHPVPSGDRQVARLLMEALGRAGHLVTVAARLRSWDGGGDAVRQARIAALGRRLARRFVARVEAGREPRPELWFTYHLYHKAPDWIGPAVSAALGIPYVVAEASVAGKQAGGPWDQGHRAVIAALGRASRAICLNPADAEGIARHLPQGPASTLLVPFLDTAPFAAAAMDRAAHRAALARRTGLDPTEPWLVAVGMMRPGDKLTSYRQLGAALARLEDRRWRLLVVGDGSARAEVAAALGKRAVLLGQMDSAAIAAVLAAADIAVWPAHNEAFGLWLLEAQAAGLPVVAGAVGGVGTIIAQGETGLLVPPGDPAAFARAVTSLLDDAAYRRRLGEAGLVRATSHHDLETAAGRLRVLLDETLG
jgi:glycosyltransferase involved in cell wall biosynthesis